MIYCPNCCSSKIECSQMVTINPPIPVYKCFDCGHEFEYKANTFEATPRKLSLLNQSQLVKIEKIEDCLNYFNNDGKYLVPGELYEYLVKYIKATKDNASLFLKNIGEE